jgi:hypothetical protein
MGTFNVHTWRDDLYPVIQKYFDTDYDMERQIINSVIGTETTDRIDYRTWGMGGLGLVPKYDGTNIPELSQKRGFQKIYTPEERAALVNVERKYAKVDMHGEAKKAGTRLARSARMTQLYDFYNLMSKAYSATQTGPDGKPLFATDHPINSEPGADTFSNLGTSAFSISAITATQSAMNRWVTPDGLYMAMNPELVLISPELEPKAREFFGKEARLIPESAENGANPVYGMKYFVIKGFTAKQWALADANLMKELVLMVELTKPEVMPNQPDNPLVAQFVAYMDYTFGWSDARCIYGHNPA